MKCHLCGGQLNYSVTDMPFKLDQKRIVILKELPVMECQNCIEFLIEDKVMEHVETIIDKLDNMTELEIVKYAA